ncbi:MAG: DUF167 domain-containing protein [Candidatus Hydrogenedentota bacterium]
MIISVHAKPGSRKEGIETMPDGTYVARIRARAVDGKANEALVELLAEHFVVPKSRIRIINPTSRHKRVEIL